jgi:hypothetical protein
MSKTRRQIAKGWADFQERTDPRCVGATVKAVATELRGLWNEHDAVTAYLRAVDEESGQAVALLALRRAHEEGQG